jgi:hypothetical protein
MVLVFSVSAPSTVFSEPFATTIANLDTSTNPVSFRFLPLGKRTDTKRLILSGILKVEKEQLYIEMNRSPSIKTSKDI